MADIKCPICSRINDENAERCWYCQAVLHPDQAAADQGSDWLDGFRNDSADNPPAESGASPSGDENPGEDVPDWLARIREREKMDRGEDETAAQEGSGQDSVDWLRDISNEMNEQESQGSEPAAAGAEEPAPAEGEENDEWLKKLESWQEQSPHSAGTMENPEQESQPAAEDIQPEKSGVSQASNEDNQPDWLKEFAIDDGSAGNEPVKAEEPFASGQFTEEEPAEAEEGPAQSPITEEMGILGEKNALPEPVTGEEMAAGEPEGAADQSQSSSSEPDWLSDFHALSPEKDLASQVLPPQQNDQTEKPPFSDRDLMNWINKDQEETAAGTPEESPLIEDRSQQASTPVEQPGEAPAEEGTIAPAAIPAWLQQLRPDKSKRAPGVNKTPSVVGDSKSPLAGIEGALRSGGVHQFYTHPQTYANTLKVTPEQESLLQRMQSIAGDVRWEARDTSQPASQKNGLLRIITMILVIGAVLFSILSNKGAIASPTLYPQAVAKSYDLVSSLDPQKPVLVAADFDSSLFGELKWSSNAVLGKLLERNISIAYLSTTPVGATLLENDLEELTSQNPAYGLTEKTADLGYLAGGTVGLQSLAQDPQATFALDVNFQPVWKKAPFDTVKKVSDFGAVIVITENADTAKYWIEQVQPSLGSTPLIVVISAQSAPMLQPYYDSGQVSGYLAGLSDAAAFENIGSSAGVANQYYGTFQTTLVVVALAIFIGGLVCLVIRTPSSERSNKERK